MQQRYQDAMAIVRKFGKPDLFITMTCNPHWLEIAAELLAGQKAEDRPDIVARVFKLKLDAFLDEIKKDGALGEVVAWMYVIEFQKRGLPHAHILIIRKHKITTADDVDKFVSAEIPTHNAALRAIVVKQMIHGPCGVGHEGAPCMKDGVCSKHFPKPFAATTTWDEDSTHPIYARRCPDDGGYVDACKPAKINNAFVVPYNPYFTLKYNCHINVEVCSSVKAAKYLFKYVYKGGDRAMMRVDSAGPAAAATGAGPAVPGPAGPGPAGPTGPGAAPQQARDEVAEYQDLRALGASESTWRMFSNDMSGRYPAVKALPVHLENGQRVYFTDDTAADVVAAEQAPATELTEWFDLNARTPENEPAPPAYYDMPGLYSWIQKKWVLKKRGDNGMIGRLYWIHPSAGEVYYLRILLCHVHSRGKHNFASLKVVHDVAHDTFQDTCLALGLLQDDRD
jgi:hypothetical protein